MFSRTVKKFNSLPLKWKVLFSGQFLVTIFLIYKRIQDRKKYLKEQQEKQSS